MTVGKAEDEDVAGKGRGLTKGEMSELTLVRSHELWGTFVSQLAVARARHDYTVRIPEQYQLFTTVTPQSGVMSGIVSTECTVIIDGGMRRWYEQNVTCAPVLLRKSPPALR